MKSSKIKNLIDVARGVEPADTVIEGARILNTLTGEIIDGNVAIHKDRIAGIGDYFGKNIMRLNGGFLVPGLIDSHVHIESSLVSPREFARAVLPRGTTTVFSDPHEIANVMGIEGVRLMIELSRNLPLSIHYLAPSCVPATDMETAGAELGHEEIASLLKNKSIAGLAEMMNFPGVIFGAPDVLRKLGCACEMVIDGHAPGLSGKDLSAYICAGIGSDHECTTAIEALEKARDGMFVMIREGTGARNLDDLITIVTEKNASRFMFATDDPHPPDLLRKGHIDYLIRKAIEKGIEPITAVRMATINPANRFRKHNIGAIAPGYLADIVWVESLEVFEPKKVWAKGVLVAENGAIIDEAIQDIKFEPPRTMNVKKFESKDFQIKAKNGAKAHIISIIPGQILTEHLIEQVKIENGFAVADMSRDILKLAVIERHKATGNIGLGFVRGFGIQNGALASSVAHDSHNIIVAGTDDESMAICAKKVADMGGGMAVASNEKTIASLPLEFGGLMSMKSIIEVDRSLENLKSSAKSIGCKIEDPFMTMGFLALPVIPKLKLTDKGLVDVEKFSRIELFA